MAKISRHANLESAMMCAFIAC